MSDNDVINDFVRISASRIKQSIDQFVSSTDGLPDDLRIGALEALVTQATVSIRGMQEMADQLKGKAAR